MKILIVHDFYQRFGGEDAVALAERKLLEAHSNKVAFYTRHNDEITHYGVKRKLVSPFDVIYSFRTRRDLQEIAGVDRPDVAYIHNFFPLVSPSLYHTLYSLKVPSVQVLHDFRFLCANGWFYTQGHICERCKHGNYLHAVRYRCYRKSYVASGVCSAILGLNRFAGLLDKISAFLCPTEFSKQKFLEVGIPEDKLFVRPHSIDASQIEPRFDPGSYVLYLGRLSDEKGLLTLLRAMGGFKDVALKVAGTGPLENHLQSYVEKRGLVNIQFVGQQTGEAKWDLLRNCLFVVVPSEWYETFCMVVIESYAAGKPVIASAIGGLPHVVENGKSGLLFHPASVEDLQEKIRYFLDRPDEVENMGRYGRRLAETKYHPDENYKALTRIFSAVISNGRPESLAAR